MDQPEWYAVKALRDEADHQLEAIRRRISELEALRSQWVQYGYKSIGGKPTVKRPRKFIG